MLPFLTFASGLVAGIVGIRVLKTVKTPESLRSATHAIGDKARNGLDQAQTGLRDAAVSSLSAIEKTSANLRGKLTPAPVEAVPAAEKPKAKPAVRKAAPRKAKAATPAPAAQAPAAPAEVEAKPARKRAARKPKAAPEAPAAEAGETS